jgi:hypothetical protein
MTNDQPGDQQTTTGESPQAQDKGTQDITLSPVAVATLDPPRACESRAAATNRWIREGCKTEAEKFRQDVRLECQAAGLSKFDANNAAWDQCMAAFPPPGEQVLPEAKSLPQTTSDSSTRLQGLSNVPEAWGKLPANASLAAELGWVQSNRLYVVEERSSNLTVVHLDRAHEPAPSRAAIGWLETSIRSYAKFVDVAAKALTQSTDEAEHIRKEDIAIEEIRALLDEMHKD